MRWLLPLAMVLSLAAWHVPTEARADGCVVDVSGSTFVDGYVIRTSKCSENGALWVEKKTQDGGEHIGATEEEGYQRVRGDFLSSGKKTADAQIKATPGYVSHMICQGTDAAAVAGTIKLHDETTETGTEVFEFTVAALDYHNPIVFPIMKEFATGIYLGYTTTSDVNCTVFYR